MNTYIKKHARIVFILVATIVAFSLFFLNKETRPTIHEELVLTQASPARLPGDEIPPPKWNVYTNTKFNYRIEHLSNTPVQVVGSYVYEYENETLATANHVVLQDVGIQVHRSRDYQNFLDKSGARFEASFYEITSPESGKEEYARVVSAAFADLKSYTNIVMYGNKNGPLLRSSRQAEEIVFQGRKAYKFILTEYVGDPLGQKPYHFRNKPYVFIFVESPAGDKFIIHYLLGDQLSEAMLKTFKFTN